jgi:transcription elongation factor GreA
MPMRDDDPNDPVMTLAGYARLTAELDELRRVRRPEAVERLHVAREAGGWNSPEYLTARDELAFLDGRIGTLERLLAQADVAEPVRAGRPQRVRVGTTATIRDQGGEEERYILVGPAEADPRRGLISDQSPVGRAILGRGVGDTVVVQTPGGTRRLTIVRIESGQTRTE